MPTQGWHSLLGLIDVEATTFPPSTQGALIIAGVDRTEWVKSNTGNFTRQFNQRSQFTCSLEDKERGYVPIVGSSIMVLLGTTRLFAGFITSVRAFRYPRKQGYNTLVYDIKATDNNLIADRRVVFYGGFIGLLSLGPGYAGAIVKALVATALTGENVNTSLVEDGPFLTDPVTFYYETFTAAMNKMCQLAPGFRWRIDEYKRLRFSDFQANPAPFDIFYPQPSRMWVNLAVTSDLDDYFNTEFARTESNVTATDTETFTGDGVTRDFFIGIDPISGNPVRWMTSKPTVFLGGVQQVVGEMILNGFSAGFDCFYDVDGIGIHFLAISSQPAPGLGVSLVVTYDYALGNVVKAQNAAQIAARQAIEGGSGIWTRVNEQRNIANGDTLLSIAEGDISAYSVPGSKVEYETIEQGLDVGQIQNINLPYYGINSDLIIESIQTRWITGSPFQFWHSIRLTNLGPLVGGDYLLSKLAEVARIGVPRNPPVRTDITGTVSTLPFVGRVSDGGGGYLLGTPANTMSLQPGPWTLCIWVRCDDLGQSSKVVFQYSELTGLHQIRIGFNAGVYYFESVGESGADPNPGSTVAPADTGWHHLAYRKGAAGASTWDLFWDGVKTVISASINFTLSDFMQRAYGFTDRAAGQYFAGAIAQIAAWPTTALSDLEILQIATGQNASSVHPTGLVDYWPIGGSANPEPNSGTNTTGLTVNGSLPPAS